MLDSNMHSVMDQLPAAARLPDLTARPLLLPREALPSLRPPNFDAMRLASVLHWWVPYGAFLYAYVRRFRDYKGFAFACTAPLCMGRAGLLHRRNFVGNAGACYRLRGGLRQPLAAMQRNGDAALGQREHAYRVHPSHHQRAFVLRGCWLARLDLCRNRSRTLGARASRSVGGVYVDRGHPGSAAGEAGVHGAESVAHAAGVSGAAPYQHSSAAGGHYADCALAEPGKGLHARRSAAGCAYRRVGGCGGGNACRGHGLAGGSGGYALPRRITRTSAGAGLLLA